VVPQWEVGGGGVGGLPGELERYTNALTNLNTKLYTQP